MKGRSRLLFRGMLLGLPLLTAALWLLSGRETLTKTARAVDVEIKDALFGDTIVEKRFVRGPVFGWYIGLDTVSAVSAGSLMIGGGAWLLGRRQGRRKESV